MEYMKSKSLLTRACGSSISQLPLVKKQADPVDWLQDELTLKFPGEAEILMVTMQGEEIDQIVKIVDAVVDAYFKEVVEKGVENRRRKEDKLKGACGRKRARIGQRTEGRPTDVGAPGYRRSDAAATQNQMLQVQIEHFE